jgi:hypothetical protein
MSSETSEPEANAGTRVAPVVATLTLTEKDLEDAIVDMSIFFRLRKGLFAVFVIMAVFGWAVGGQALSAGTIVPQVITFLAFGAFVFLTPRRNARLQLQALTAAGDANVTYRFDDEGVTIRSAGATASIAYRRLTKIRRGKTALLLYTTEQIANIVPLRAFSEGELPRVLAFLPPAVTPKKLSSGTRLVILWVSAVLAFLVMWQFLSKQAPAPAPLPSGVEEPGAR